jgi:hypothetical protein
VGDEQAVYSLDDVAIGKLMVDMDRIGFGPKDGHDPEDPRYVADFVKEFVVNSFKNTTRPTWKNCLQWNFTKNVTNFMKSSAFLSIICIVNLPERRSTSCLNPKITIKSHD